MSEPRIHRRLPYSTNLRVTIHCIIPSLSTKRRKIALFMFETYALLFSGLFPIDMTVNLVLRLRTIYIKPSARNHPERWEIHVK
jgi:hypothetical protein